MISFPLFADRTTPKMNRRIETGSNSNELRTEAELYKLAEDESGSNKRKTRLKNGPRNRSGTTKSIAESQSKDPSQNSVQANVIGNEDQN